MATATIPVGATAAAATPAPKVFAAWLAEPVRTPALVGASGFAAGILCAHLWWFRPGCLLVALVASFAIGAVGAHVTAQPWTAVAH